MAVAGSRADIGNEFFFLAVLQKSGKIVRHSSFFIDQPIDGRIQSYRGGHHKLHKFLPLHTNTNFLYIYKRKLLSLKLGQQPVVIDAIIDTEKAKVTWK